MSGFCLLGLHYHGGEDVGLPLEFRSGLELGLGGLLGDPLGLGYLPRPLHGCKLLPLGLGCLLTLGLGEFLAAAGPGPYTHLTLPTQRRV